MSHNTENVDSPANVSSRLRTMSVVFAAMGEFIDGYDIAVVGTAIIFLTPLFHLDKLTTGILLASGFAGAVVGQLSFGYVSDRLGRRFVYLFNLIIFIIFAVLSALVTNVDELIALRLAIGFAIGMDIPATLAYLTEISPSAVRGRNVGISQVMWAIGLFSTAILAYALLPLGKIEWRVMFAIGAIPALAVWIGRRFIPESPRYLAKIGDWEGAKRNAQRLGLSFDVLTLQQNQPHKQTSRFTELFGKQYRSRTVAVSIFFVAVGLTGPITTISTPYILNSVGVFTHAEILLFTAAVYVGDLLGALVGSLLIDKMKRRILGIGMLIGTIVTAYLMSLVGLGLHIGEVLVASYLGFGFFLWGGPIVIQRLMGSELFPTRIRASAQGFVSVWLQALAAASTFLVPIGLAAIGGVTFISILALSLFAFLVVLLVSPFLNTSKQELEAISA